MFAGEGDAFRTNQRFKLLSDPDACFYVCGLKAMEEGVVLALRDVAVGADGHPVDVPVAKVVDLRPGAERVAAETAASMTARPSGAV